MLQDDYKRLMDIEQEIKEYTSKSLSENSNKLKIVNSRGKLADGKK